VAQRSKRKSTRPRRIQQKRAETPDLTVRLATPGVWESLRDLFDNKGPCGRCWCMYWRIGGAYRKQSADDNRRAFRDIVERGPPPGLIAFDGDRAVGWCQLTPRASLPWLDRNWRVQRVDDVPVWVLSCFYVRIGYRRRGVTSQLIEAAKDAARKAGAPALEAYPLDASRSPSATSTGYLSQFRRAGFRVVARHVPQKPIVRLNLT
jgi:GNAT superfamily N-acetyltransferase